MLFVICYKPPSAPVNVFTSQMDKIIADCPSSKNLVQNNFLKMLNVYGLVQLNTIPST